MKKIILFITVFCSLFLLSSCQSNEDKVKKLVLNELDRIGVYGFESYDIEVQESIDPDELSIYYIYFQDNIENKCYCMKYRYFEYSNAVSYQEDCDCSTKR